MVVIIETGMEIDVVNVKFHDDWQRGGHYQHIIMMPVRGLDNAAGKQKRTQ